jgi:hypothetical protein
MVGCAFERNVRSYETAQGVAQFSPGWIRDGYVVKTRCPRGWRRTFETFPRVQADVMMITAGGQKRRLLAKPLRQFEPKHTAIEINRTLKIGHFQMNVADTDVRVDGARRRIGHTRIVFPGG